MRLAYITSQYARAGDTFIRGEVRELRRLGHDVATFSIRRPPASELVDDEIRQEQAGTDYIVDGVGSVLRLGLAFLRTAAVRPMRLSRAIRLSLSTGRTGLRARVWQIVYVMEAAYLARRLELLRVEHLHDHIGENSGTVAMLASAISGVPFSMTIHGPGTFYNAPQHALGLKVSRSAFTVCISNFCRSQCMVFVPPQHWHRLKVVRCGIDLSRFTYRPTPGLARRRIVCVGRLCADKAQMLLIEAARRVVDRGLDFELWLVGDGPMRAELAGRVEALKVGHVVTLKGWMGSEATRDAIAGASAMVLPSFAEGLPIVLMESLAVGRPVLTTWVAGIPELVNPGVNGWLVCPGSVDELADALEELVRTPAERLGEMGAAGHEQIDRLHNVEKQVARLVELFARSTGGDSCLAAKGKSAVHCVG